MPLIAADVTRRSQCARTCAHPHHESLAKLYSVSFYRALRAALAPHGIAALQLGSPFFANRTYWSAIRTLETAGLTLRPYHAHVPSFGEWGFALAARGPIPAAVRRPFSGRFLTPAVEPGLFVFPPDLRAQHEVRPNTLVHPRIVNYFQRDWRGWN